MKYDVSTHYSGGRDELAAIVKDQLEAQLPSLSAEAKKTLKFFLVDGYKCCCDIIEKRMDSAPMSSLIYQGQYEEAILNKSKTTGLVGHAQELALNVGCLAYRAASHTPNAERIPSYITDLVKMLG